MHPHAPRLFALDEALRAEADRMLADSGIGAILAEAGYGPVGSYPMRTMTWRDLDFERAAQAPDWDEHWEVGTRLMKTGWCFRLQCENVHRHAWGPPGLYWGLRLADPAHQQLAWPEDPRIWKIDLWTIPAEHVAANRAQREKWMRLLDDDARSYVLAIKEAVCHDPAYRKTMLSVHIYEAVLEHGIRDVDAFRAWWEARKP